MDGTVVFVVLVAVAVFFVLVDDVQNLDVVLPRVPRMLDKLHVEAEDVCPPAVGLALIGKRLLGGQLRFDFLLFDLQSGEPVQNIFVERPANRAGQRRPRVDLDGADLQDGQQREQTAAAAQKKILQGHADTSLQPAG